MRNTWIICRKELRSYFVSPVAYLLLTMFAVIFGFFFWNAVGYFVYLGMEAQLRDEATPMNVNEQIIRPLLANLSVVGLFFIPIITMRLFAEEKRQGTIELLATSPISDWQIVLGKFVAASALYALMILAGLVNVAGIWIYATSSPEWKPVVTGALGLFLLGACFLAMGTFVSTLTRNQIVAGILGFCLFLGMWTLGWADEPTAGPLMQAVAYLGVTTHLEDLVKGVVDLKDVVFYLSVITFGLFLAHQSVESQRWRA